MQCHFCGRTEKEAVLLAPPFEGSYKELHLDFETENGAPACTDCLEKQYIQAAELL